MIRTALIALAATVALGTAAPVLAGGFPATNSNLGTISNTAAGIGNFAGQSVTGVQVGKPGGFGFNQNLGSASNLAAGVNNKAVQNIQAFQFGGKPGGLVNSNIGTVNNTAAGIGNVAKQSVFGMQVK